MKLKQIYGLIKIYKRKEIETSALRGLSCKIEKGQETVLMTKLVNFLYSIELQRKLKRIIWE
jgi:hypothetical protein